MWKLNTVFLSEEVVVHGMSKDLLGQIGNTPLVRIQKMIEASQGVEIRVKLEFCNPGGSVKDRAALRMIEEGERSGELTKDKVILDSTSGNTGVAYAMIGAVKGYRVKLVIPENVSLEKRRTIGAFGGEIVFTDPTQGSDGAQREADRICRMCPEHYFKPDQYNNPANWRAHYDTTGPEIIRQTEGQLTHLVAGVGTGGTMMGTLRRLRAFDGRIQGIAVQPATSLHGIEGLKHMASSIVPRIYDGGLPDATAYVETEDAYEMVKWLAREEGLLVGQSSGAAMKAALDLARTLKEGLIVVIFPDGGGRYLNTRMWDQDDD